MSLQDWQTNGWLKPHVASVSEIAQLTEVVERDLRDCEAAGLSDDWRFSIAYNAALQLAHAALAAAGYETPKGESHHFRVIQSLEHTVGADRTFIQRFDLFRKKRNAGVYERAGSISRQDASAMISLAKDLQVRVLRWIAADHPQLLA
ncbi:MAG TPA: hypothetical protein VFC78_03440 [Tepidisphaeraceae bacterium]|nr:hypothetical protein [Tepidisphaeraceae bacterium]